ncbi:unnamed protein product [Notodromas monacha]|uniref:D-isomer specific 2-hydroxyacid dehydrogenase NAD-binding domain-containing protein n=1 Tax=Notodromas monacha TaxID=399045 RepID=A0A7R9GHV3_9CRUS|nr:unnamed protein product [Notodromas monacha]CAG0923199.1 unnamed protein product [Notodromas monacha]
MAKHPQIFVLSQAFPDLTDYLSKEMPDVDFVKITSPGVQGECHETQSFGELLKTKLTSEVLEKLKTVEFVVIDAHFLGQAMYDLPNLKWAHLTWAGVEKLFTFIDHAKEPPKFPICRYSGKHFGQQMSEYAVWAVVGFERGLFRAAEHQKQGIWVRDGRMHRQQFIRRMTCGIMGVGMIGSHGHETQSFGELLKTKLTSEVLEKLKTVEFVVIDAHFLGQAMYDLPNLKWAHLTWAGVEKLFTFIDHAKEPPKFPICRYSGKHFGQQMSEYAVWAVVGFERGLFRAAEHQKQGIWVRDGRMHRQQFIRRMTCGIMGVGMIGSHVAQTFKTFGGDVIGLGLHEKTKEDIPFLRKYWTVDKLDEFLAECDVIISILPATQLTIGLLNNSRLEACKKQPLFINIGRGNLIADAEIIRALDNGWIRGAVLDVFMPEPLPESSPLWRHENVHITPHVAGVSKEEDIVEQVSESFSSMLGGGKLEGLIDFTEGY